MSLAEELACVPLVVADVLAPGSAACKQGIRYSTMAVQGGVGSSESLVQNWIINSKCQTSAVFALTSNSDCWHFASISLSSLQIGRTVNAQWLHQVLRQAQCNRQKSCPVRLFVGRWMPSATAAYTIQEVRYRTEHVTKEAAALCLSSFKQVGSTTLESDQQ